MTTWLVAFRERKFLTRSEGEYIEMSLVSETVESEMDSCFEPTERGIEFFKSYHERADGDYSVEIKVLSWSELKEDYDDEENQE